MNDIRLMVAGTKQTSYLGKPAWYVPNNQCTTDFEFACKCWEHFLNGNSDWFFDAMTKRST